MHTPELAFCHHRLDVYKLACEFAMACRSLSTRIPRGDRHIADHLKRSSSATVLLIAEGANRHSRGTKRQRFAEARGECGEAAAALELALGFGLLPQEQSLVALQLAARVCAMLTRLVQRFS